MIVASFKRVADLSVRDPEYGLYETQLETGLQMRPLYAVLSEEYV